MEIFQVGGSVRDELMGVQPKDRDWVVINSSPEEMEKEGFKPIGKDFPVFLHPDTNEEYALARTEKKSGVGYKGFQFYFDSDVTLEEDLKRRDFTINSIAKDKNGNIIDPFNGKLDIEKKIFRHTSSAFIEDPLRVLRFARFQSYSHLFDFEICSETVDCFKKIINARELKELSPERVWMETKKALENKHPEKFFEVLIKYQLTDPWFKKLNTVSCDGSSPELRWADIQRVNNFQLSDLLPIPNSFQKTQDLLRQVLDFFQCNNMQDKLKLIEKMSINRNFETLEEIKKYNCLKDHKSYLEKIFKSVLEIDFSCLADIPASEVSHKKQFLYHETLKGIL